MHLDSYHHEGNRLIVHELGVHSAGPPRRFLFRYRDEGGCSTELLLDEESDGTFRAVFTYPGYPGARDQAIASIGTAGPDAWEIELSGIWDGKPYDMTFYAKRADTPTDSGGSVKP